MPEIAYTETGSGRNVVLIHGFCESKEMWEQFRLSLSSTYRVYCLDLPGFGDSILTDSAISIDNVAKTLQDWLEKKGITHPVIVGHSLGGYVALAMAKRMGNSLGGICLFHSTAFADDEAKKNTRNKTLIFLEKYGTSAFVTSFVPQLFAEDQRDILKETISQLIERAQRIRTEVLVAYTKAMRDRPDHSDLLKNRVCHTAMIAGELDTAVSIENSRRHQDWVDYYLELKDTGHMGMFERPKETLAFLEDYLAASFRE